MDLCGFTAHILIGNHLAHHRPLRQLGWPCVGDGNGARVTQDGAGIEMGVDYRGEANGWAMGVDGGRQSGGLHTAARASHAGADSGYLGGYGRYGNVRAGRFFRPAPRWYLTPTVIDPLTGVCLLSSGMTRSRTIRNTAT